jgi:WD40 repeat protein
LFSGFFNEKNYEIVAVVASGVRFRRRSGVGRAQAPRTHPFDLASLGQLVFANDERTIVKGGTNLVGAIEIYNRKTGKVNSYQPAATHQGDAGSTSPVVLGRTPFVAGIGGFPNSSGNSIGIYDLRSQKNFRVIARHQIAGRVLIATRDGRTLIATHRDGGIGFWDVKTGVLKRRWTSFGKGETAPQALAISRDGPQNWRPGNYYMNYGSSAQSGTDGGQNPQIWNLRTGKLLVSAEKVNWRKLPRDGGGMSWSTH